MNDSNFLSQRFFFLSKLCLTESTSSKSLSIITLYDNCFRKCHWNKDSSLFCENCLNMFSPNMSFWPLIKPGFKQVALLMKKKKKMYKDSSYVLFPLEASAPCVIDLFFRRCLTMRPLLSSSHPQIPVLPPVSRVKASAIKGQAKHAELSEGGRAEHAAQCLDAR